MPRLDGFGLLRALRDDPGLRALPVILLSARAGEESRVDGLEAGADDYLVKPFSARELIARVHAHLTLAQERSEALAREEAGREEAERGQSGEGRVPRRAVARAADAAHRHARLGAPLCAGAARRRGAIQRALETIERNAAAGRLISDLLDVSRIVAGKLTLDARSICAARLRSCVETFRPTAEEKSIAIRRRARPRRHSRRR